MKKIIADMGQAVLPKIILFSLFFSISCGVLQTSSIGPKGDPGPAGPAGSRGPKGSQGPKGKDGKSVPNELIIKIEESIRSSDNESVVGTVAYSFGIAPRITGFAYLTSSGKLFKFENKNPQKLGDEVKLVTQLSKTQRFISFGRTTYGDDIKQFFTAITENGNIFTSEDLDSWSKVASIPLTK